jgi:hypothetical protein
MFRQPTPQHKVYQVWRYRKPPTDDVGCSGIFSTDLLADRAITHEQYESNDQYTWDVREWHLDPEFSARPVYMYNGWMVLGWSVPLAETQKVCVTNSPETLRVLAGKPDINLADYIVEVDAHSF